MLGHRALRQWARRDRKPKQFQSKARCSPRTSSLSLSMRPIRKHSNISKFNFESRVRTCTRMIKRTNETLTRKPRIVREWREHPEAACTLEIQTREGTLQMCLDSHERSIREGSQYCKPRGPWLQLHDPQISKSAPTTVSRIPKNFNT